MLLVAVLVVLAISDLVVGVSNDAVNFLNSAIGSRSAPFWVIMIIASAGILFGATFSEGMMEVARKSIFHPEMFSFKEIMVIFLAVMLTDIILLDTFNTLGLPTSTTVSIVFELLGAAVAVAVLKMTSAGEDSINAYINSGKALAIISGILLSVVVAFSIGTIVQFLVRLLFSFNYDKSYKYFGALWGGIAISAITYFILIKGAKGASFMTSEAKEFISANTISIIAYSFIVWTSLLAILQFVFRLNILKIIVLIGTFALAMAFAGNDLVNFIGVPLAGMRSYDIWVNSGTGYDDFMMTALGEKFKTETLYLLIAGIIMVITLWLSKKARSVSATELNLSKQGGEYEQFEANQISRVVVRFSIGLSKAVSYVMPRTMEKGIMKRFSPSKKSTQNAEPAFDLVRASVNLTLASILISLATSFKLPLSTTYVTFMVGMGTSLADGAWGRDSAVYRVSGVVTVITGWFFTAFIAFSVAFLVALVISLTNLYATPVLLIIAILLLIRSTKAHSKKEADTTKILDMNKEEKSMVDINEKCRTDVSTNLHAISNIYSRILNYVKDEDRKKLKKLNTELNLINKAIKKSKDDVNTVISDLNEDSIDTGHYYVQVLDYLRETAHALTFILKPFCEHFDNEHRGFTKNQIASLRKLSEQVQNLLGVILDRIENSKFDDIDEVVEMSQVILKLCKETRIDQIKRIKKSIVGTKNSILFFNTVAETKNMVLFSVNLLKSQRDFVIYQDNHDATITEIS